MDRQEIAFRGMKQPQTMEKAQRHIGAWEQSSKYYKNKGVQALSFAKATADSQPASKPWKNGLN